MNAPNHTSEVPTKSIANLRSTWAIENTIFAIHRFVALMFHLADARIRMSVQAIGVQMLVIGNDRSGCLERTLGEVAEATGASRSAVEKTLRTLVHLKIMRREQGLPGQPPTFRWLRPVADRVVLNDAPARHRIGFWRSVEVLASTMVEQQTAESEPKQAEPEQQLPAAAATNNEVVDLDVGTVFQALSEVAAKALWIDTHKAWRLRTLELRTKDREVTRWAVLLDFVNGFEAKEQQKAVELALRVWPEVASEKVKQAQYPLSWLENDIAGVERRVRQALAQRRERQAAPEVAAAPPPRLKVPTWNGPRKVAAA